MSRPEDRLVYSTDQPFQAREPVKKQPAGKKSSALPDDGILRVARERRKASVVTIIHGLAPSEIDGIARELKRRCGGGGTTKDGVVTLQGDHRDTIIEYFEAQNRRCKKAGG